MPSLNSVLSFFSAIALLGVSPVFGFMSMPTEMGLSILAGSLGLAFSNIDKISEFSGAGFSAKMKNQFQAVVDKETEQEENTALDEQHSLNDIEKSVIKALSNPQFTWRTLPGISKASSLSESEAWKILVLLIQKELVQAGNKNKTGEMIWSLTQSGRSYAN